MVFGDIYINWIRDFLSKRTQRVQLRGRFSEPIVVLRVMLQDAVLGLLLYIMFANDITDILNAKVKGYADNKIKVMQFGNNSPKQTYETGNAELAKVTNEKDIVNPFTALPEQCSG